VIIVHVVVGLCVAHQTTLHPRFSAKRATATKLIHGRLAVYCKLLWLISIS